MGFCYSQDVGWDLLTVLPTSIEVSGYDMGQLPRKGQMPIWQHEYSAA